jgi:uncharacterized protein (DUF2267 family)
MEGTKLAALDTTLQRTHQWLNEIMADLAEGDQHLAYGALRAVLHALRDRLTVEEAAHLGAQLPMLIRGLYYDGWSPIGKPAKTHKAEFLEAIRHQFPPNISRPSPEMLARSVFRVLARHISPGEVRDVQSILPKELRELWPAAATSTGEPAR